MKLDESGEQISICAYKISKWTANEGTTVRYRATLLFEKLAVGEGK